MAAFGSAISAAGGMYGGAKMQQGMSQYRPSSFDPEIYSTPSTNIGGPNDPSNWA
jgi:hypothetical protein